MSTPVITARATNSGKTLGGSTGSGNSVTIGSTGSSLILTTFYDTSLNTLNTVDWGGTNLTQVASAAAGAGNADVWALHNCTAGSHNITLTFSGVGTLFFAVCSSEVSGIAASPNDKTAAAVGTSTTPSSGATAATTQATEIVWGCVGTNGPSGDTAGTWSNSFTAGQRVGTTGGVATTNGTVSEGWLQVAATGAQTAAKTGITSRGWGAACATFKMALDTSVTLAIASGTSTALAQTIGIGAVSQTLAVASSASVALAETVGVGAVSNTLGIASGASAALAMTTLAADNINLGIAVATSTAPQILFNSLLYYPSSAGAVVTTFITQPQLNTAASVGIRSYGNPYFAAWMLNTASAAYGSGQWPGIVGQEVSGVLIVALHSAPVQASSPTEPHWLFSQHDVTTGQECFSIGVTPNLSICAITNGGPLILSPPSSMPVDSKFHQINFATQGDSMNTGIISLDGVPLVSETGCGTATGVVCRSMLFNGAAASTQCSCSILAAELVGQNPPVEWPLNEGSGSVINGAQVLSSLGQVPIVYQIPSDFPGTDFTLTPGWASPLAPNPLVWGSVPTHDSGSAWSWISNTQFTPITVQKPNYRPLLGPPTSYTPETDQSPG